jgi:hypothetical protein
MTTSTAPARRPAVLTKAVKLWTRGPSVALRNWRRQRLRHAYRNGTATRVRELPEEWTDPRIITAGQTLRQQLLATYDRKHGTADYRVLMLRPGSITAEIWFGDLQRCMQHAGIECQVLPPDTTSAGVNAAFETWQPNVFIATEAVDSLRLIDLQFVRRYKRERGCLRLFVPVWHSNAPREDVPAGRSTHEQDEWRRRLRCDGLSADAHFSIFEPEFHQQFAHDARGPQIDYAVIPMACNPFTDYPVPAQKQYDYIMATSMTDERVEVSYQYLRPILGRYRGLWAGPRWGFGIESIAPSEMPLQYARTRIALSPLVGFVRRYAAEITHRVYATAACGTFQITLPTAITGRYFRSDELVQAASPAEYVQLFDHFVGHPGERNDLALAALRRVYAEHTGLHRVDSLVKHWDGWRRRGLF